MELSVRDVATGAGFQIEVTPGGAMDAFHHPYAYAAYRVEHASATLTPINPRRPVVPESSER